MSFHLSLPVRNLEESRAFFADALRATITHDDARGYINLDLHGTQLTLQERPAMPTPSADMHFGINLPLDEFEALATHLRETAVERIKVKPTVVDAGTPRERRKMFLTCPTGYLIEIKGVDS